MNEVFRAVFGCGFVRRTRRESVTKRGARDGRAWITREGEGWNGDVHILLTLTPSLPTLEVWTVKTTGMPPASKFVVFNAGIRTVETRYFLQHHSSTPSSTRTKDNNGTGGSARYLSPTSRNYTSTTGQTYTCSLHAYTPWPSPVSPPLLGNTLYTCYYKNTDAQQWHFYLSTFLS
jgi:hypothetical protein